MRAALLLGALALAACTPTPGTPPTRAAAPGLTAADAEASPAIAALLARQSALSAGSPFDEVARAVLAANSRPKEAELRAARLRAAAAQKNWLPTLGPEISLTSMGDLVATLLIEQVLFDNGGKRAERAYAAADVEVAAVALAEDTNARVATALGVYIAAERARAGAAVTRTALARAHRFERIMERRVAGGISDRTELSVVSARRAELESALERLTQEEATALAELDAMAARPLGGLSGLGTLSAPAPDAGAALSVVRAGAEARRAEAEVRVARAGLLPGLTAGATVGDTGSDGVGLVAAGAALGLGTPDRIGALDATREAASRQTARAGEDARRALAALAARRDSLAAQEREARALAAESEEIYRQYERQYEAGFRTVLDVVGTFERALGHQREAVRLAHERARVEVEIAALTGRLVDGGAI